MKIPKNTNSVDDLISKYGLLYAEGLWGEVTACFTED